MTQLFTLPKTMLRMALSVAALLLVFTATSTFAAEPVVLTDSIDSYPLGLHFEYYEDTTGSLTLQDVLSPEVSRQFKQNKKIVANFGKTRSAYWFRFTVMNRMSSAQELLLASSWPLYDHIDLFIQNRSGVYEHREHGNVFPFHHREIDNRNFVFRISPPRNEPQVVYIRIQTETSMQAPFIIYDPDKFTTINNIENLIDDYWIELIWESAGK
ncbi:MAG TPA: 7TM-DISM domain-containing protein [Spirochaetota bacterium]|nr:7TM-DISM domain-containing protein [Spirochaetota bacterium]